MSATDSNRRHRQVMRRAVAELKKEPCVDCGGRFDPVCMDYDHRDPHTKTKSVSWLVDHGRSLEVICDEIRKCDLVCSNCHRLRTHRRGLHRFRRAPGVGTGEYTPHPDDVRDSLGGRTEIHMQKGKFRDATR